MDRITSVPPPSSVLPFSFPTSSHSFGTGQKTAAGTRSGRAPACRRDLDPDVAVLRTLKNIEVAGLPLVIDAHEEHTLQGLMGEPPVTTAARY